ncbi:MAG: acyl carrier protein [Sulfurimonas sp.]|nr:acyl carrier protein [Sulfurimonas sp.]
MLTKENVFEKIKIILVEEFEIKEDDITLESNLFTELELDSLDAIDLMVTLDKELNIEIKTEEMENLITVDNVCDFVVATANSNE